jgi:hypothetical protein
MGLRITAAAEMRETLRPGCHSEIGAETGSPSPLFCMSTASIVIPSPVIVVSNVRTLDFTCAGSSRDGLALVPTAGRNRQRWGHIGHVAAAPSLPTQINSATVAVPLDSNVPSDSVDLASSKSILSGFTDPSIVSIPQHGTKGRRAARHVNLAVCRHII